MSCRYTFFFFFSSRRRHTRCLSDWSSDVCSSDVLVSTMIVESGLDVPNANTMIVNRADQFGLAQLYQLRGRVGRSHRRAYCYLLVPDLVDADAEERLRVLEHHTDLGSGYRIEL